MRAAHILIASPVKKDAKILQAFLTSLAGLETGGHTLSYCFIDDNDDPSASALLRDFADRFPNTHLRQAGDICPAAGQQKGDHVWDWQKTERIAYIKNKMIDFFLAGAYTHLFLIDADLVLHPQTLLTLLDSHKDIIANIFWTKWQENAQPLPQVWLKDFYTLYDAHMLRPRSPEQASVETALFLNQLKIPGVYQVGGLGACTLLTRDVLQAGVNFNSLYNLSFWGEDRSFCIRAVAFGFTLYVSTLYPAFHIYRMDDLDRLPQWLADQAANTEK